MTPGKDTQGREKQNQKQRLDHFAAPHLLWGSSGCLLWNQNILVGLKTPNEPGEDAECPQCLLERETVSNQVEIRALNTLNIPSYLMACSDWDTQGQVMIKA